ncbi:serine hydrolase [Paraglaciecola sp.]|uniref:serine hydrolase domain-containing protein n=1 Tax=Paraglaciecola sp. TaxID=1920173 RepID=UPI00273F3DBF|nr:serine hydrolase domain-containing protein [Paraglaciecola sp.]MDP5030492.1 beta-lactamase family protein [Paraglaciecola sp.]
MANIIVFSFVAAGFLFGSHASFAKESVNPNPVRNMFIDAVASDTVPGISVAVADKTGVIWAEGFGYADLENKVPMSPLHKLRIGSVAKVMTAAAMMRMVEQSKIDLDAPVTQYTPLWPDFHPTITLRQLAAHTSGVRHYKQGADEFLLNQAFSDIKSALALFKDEPLLFTPGTQHQYTTFGWTLVSAAMEGADKQRNFQQIMQQEVFEPLKLQDTVFDEQYPIIAHRARPYSFYQGQLLNSPQTDHSYKWAGGGFIATPSDVVRFAVSQLDETYLSATTTNLMFKKAILQDGSEVNFGVGWQIGFEPLKQNKAYQAKELQSMMSTMPHVVMHSGGSMGGTTMLILCTEHARAVTVVKNVNGDKSANVFLLALKALSFYHNHH